jgi:hypothetical protein
LELLKQPVLPQMHIMLSVFFKPLELLLFLALGLVRLVVSKPPLIKVVKFFVVHTIIGFALTFSFAS